MPTGWTHVDGGEDRAHNPVVLHAGAEQRGSKENPEIIDDAQIFEFHFSQQDAFAAHVRVNHMNEPGPGVSGL